MQSSQISGDGNLLEPNPNSARRRNIFDSHCHIDRVFRQWRRKLSPEPIKILSESFPEEFGSKFEGCITVNCDPRLWKPEFWQWQVTESNVWMTFGCHPNMAEYYDFDTDLQFLKNLHEKKTVAVGEIGLDGFCAAKPDVQIKIFHRQLEIAKLFKKPVCLHIRGGIPLMKKANSIMQEVLPDDWPIHMHCFTDNWILGERWLKSWPSMKFGINPSKYKNDFVLNIPLDRILLETDAPYFVPLNKRPKFQFGVPGFVFHSAVVVSQIKNVDIDLVLETSRRNVEAIYGIPFNPKAA